jgi:hypothetical protein
MREKGRTLSLVRSRIIRPIMCKQSEKRVWSTPVVVAR